MTIRTFAIGGEAQDDEGSARLVAHFAAGGRTGVLGPLDCRILPLTTPGPGFRMAVGAVSNGVPAKPRQKYLIEVDQEETVNGLTGTGSSGSRHDLVVLRTDNPNLPGGGQRPADPLLGPYSGIEVITGVPFGTKSFEALAQLYAGTALARIEYPPSVSTIGGGSGNAKIVDLRAVPSDGEDTSGTGGGSDPVPGTDPVGTPPAAASQTFWDIRRGVSGQSNVNMPAGAFGAWPSNPGAAFQVPVPSWAKSAVYKVAVENAFLDGGRSGGYSRLKIGTVAQPSQGYYYPITERGSTKITSAGTAAIAADQRGKLVPFTFEAYRLTGTGLEGVPIFWQGGSYLELWVHFRA